MSVDSSKLEGLRIDHPDEPRGPSKVVWIVFVILILIATTGGFLLVRAGTPEVQLALAEETRTAARSTVLNASGYVTARRQATVSSKVTGKVIDVLIEEGMEVTEGQLLATLDRSIASASLKLVKAQEVAAEKSLEETRVRIREARLEYERVRRLTAEEVSSQSALDQAEAQLQSLEARLEVQQEDLAVARRQVALSQQQFDDTEIRAPFAGVVVSKNAQPGEMISPISAGGGFTRTGICTIVDMDSLEIEVDVNEAYITRVSAEQPVEAVLDAYPDWKIPSHVIAIIPAADRQKATVRVRIGFDERDARILPDMGVKVAFIATDADVQETRSNVTVPKSALRRDGEKDIVLVVSDDHVERRAVSVGDSRDDRVELLSGLTAGERVVIAGPEDLSDGDKVRVEKKESS